MTSNAKCCAGNKRKGALVSSAEHFADHPKARAFQCCVNNRLEEKDAASSRVATEIGE